MNLYYILAEDAQEHYVLANDRNEAKEKYINWTKRVKGIWSTDIKNCYILKHFVQ